METINLSEENIQKQVWEIKWVQQETVKLIGEVFNLKWEKKGFFALIAWKPELWEWTIDKNGQVTLL